MLLVVSNTHPTPPVQPAKRVRAGGRTRALRRILVLVHDPRM